ncbi:MAG: hypothetical protein MRY72_13035 [Aquisalinus sp.]|nr:hypothetical protein [Aquisalinus sp.]
MVQSVKTHQTGFNAGIISPEIHEREDIAAYYQGARDIVNCRVLPQGGVKIRNGTGKTALLPRMIQLLSLGFSATVTAGGQVTGGAVSKGSWQNAQIASINSGGDSVIATVDLIQAEEVFAVDLSGIFIEGTELAQVQLESADNAGGPWSVRSVVDVGAEQSRSRRLLADRVTARYWRVRMTNVTSLPGRALTLGGMTFYRETTIVSNILKVEFTDSQDKSYAMFLTDQNALICRDRVVIGAASIPHTSAQIAEATIAQSYDTLLIFHPDVAPWRIFNQGGGTDWDFRKQKFDNIPNVDFGDTVYTNAVDEEQQINFEGFAENDTYNLQFDGETTTAISYSANAATHHTRIRTALSALDTLSDTVVSVTGTAKNARIVFNENSSGRDWPEIRGFVVSSNEGVITSVTLVNGEPGGEPIISETRGWPACGIFAQNRLFLGGFKSLGNTILGSVYGDFFNLSQASSRATGGLEIPVSSEKATNIRQLHSSTFLLVFTTSAMFNFGTNQINADEVVPIVLSVRQGIESNLPPYELDGGTVFVQRGGRAIQDAVYTEAGNRFASAPASTRAEHLIREPIGMTVRRSDDEQETDLLFLAKADGEIAVFNSLRAEQVTAWSRYITQGKFLDVANQDDGPAYFVVSRDFGNGIEYFIEHEQEDAFLDGVITYQSVSEQKIFSGLSDYDGAEVFVLNDDFQYGPYTVAGGQVACDVALSGTVHIGLWYDAYVENLDPRSGPENASTMDERKRIVKVTGSFVETPAAQLRHINRVYDFPFRELDEISLDVGALSNPFTGRARIAGLTGWQRDAFVRVERASAGNFHMRSMAMEVTV